MWLAVEKRRDLRYKTLIQDWIWGAPLTADGLSPKGENACADEMFKP
jgi:hypothetical protein